MNKNYSASAVVGVLAVAASIVYAQSGSKTDPRIQVLLDRAISAHGGRSLTELRTFKETAEMRAAAPFGMRLPAQKVQVLLDRNAQTGRWQQLTDKGEPAVIYQQTPAGVFIWTRKSRTEKLRDADTPSAFVPLTKTGVLGLLALQHTTDALAYVEQGEIKAKKGPMIVRTQTKPQETLLLVGKGDLVRAFCQTTWSYLFAPDGTLIAERVTQTQTGRVTDVQVSYDRFQTFGGIKVPTEIAIKNDQVPGMVKLRMHVNQVSVNGPMARAEFQLP